jgi:hypothetical protein
MRSQQIVLSEVAYLLRSCEYLIEAIRAVEQTARQLDDLLPFQEDQIHAATSEAVGAIRGHLDIATRFAEDWQFKVQNSVT